MNERFTDVGAASDLPEGELRGVTLPDGEVICLFNHRGTFGAVGGQCTHAEFDMADGVLHDDGTIECVWHGARFDCRSGAVRRHPATEPLPVYSVRVIDGRVLLGAVSAIPAERRR